MPSSPEDLPTNDNVPPLLLFDARTDQGKSPHESGDGIPIVDAGDWRVINDTVMGGQSSSQFSVDAGHATFSGTVSLDGGGFASVRSPSGSYDLATADQFVLMVRGDGKTYNFTAYTGPGARVSYRSRFKAPPDWTRIKIPFASLTPYRRGRKVPSAPAFSPADVREVGFLIGDKQDGPFELNIQWIGGA